MPNFIKLHSKLAIFKVYNKEKQIIYTPGYSIELPYEISDNELIQFFDNPNVVDNALLKSIIDDFINLAENTENNWQSINFDDFQIKNLTIHCGIECNLNCEYCYTKNSKTNNSIIKGFPDIQLIESTLNHIIKQKKQTNKLTIVYHGSGEPTLFWDELISSYSEIYNILTENNIKPFFYISTNAQITKIQLDWLIENIDLIGLSYHGLRYKKNENILDFPEICKELAFAAKDFDIRITITPERINKQYDVVKYLIENCFATHIRIEPQYLQTNSCFSISDAKLFYNQFKKAQNYANLQNVECTYSGVRLDELHGTYCEILRNSLRLTPNGLFGNCFAFLKKSEKYFLGQITNQQIKLIDNPHELKKQAQDLPKPCNECINIYHCSRTCPDFCIYDKNAEIEKFKCKLNQLISTNYIINKHQ